jgi:hypothetical protein
VKSEAASRAASLSYERTDVNGSTDQFPETFLPNRPATVEGVFDRYDAGVTRDGDEKPIAVLEIDGRERSLWLLSKVLRNQFRKLNPEQGERLVITFAGEKTKSASGRQYWNDIVVAPDRPVEPMTVDHPLFQDDAEEVDDHGTPIRY